MFNFIFRPYVPGFRIRPQDDVPGFNIDENGMTRRGSAWSEAMDPWSAPIGLTAFRPNDEVLGFNVAPSEDASAIDLNEDDEEPEEKIWSTETLPTPADIEEPVQPRPSPFPEWIDKLVPMLRRLPTILDPLTGQRSTSNSPASLPSTELRSPEKLPYSDVFSENVLWPVTDTQSTYLQRAFQSAVPRAWPQRRLDSWPYGQLSRLRNPSNNEIIQHPIGHPELLEARPIERSNFSLGNTASHDGRQPQRQTPWQQYQKASPPLGTATSGGAGLRAPPAIREPVSMSPPPAGTGRPPSSARQVYAQGDRPQIASRSALYRRDAAGLPIGTILSGIRPIDGTVAPYDPNVQFVGDGNSLEDVPRNERHERGVEASIADHLAKGFELVARGPRAVDVPGFSSPRLYDYIIRDPATGLCYGVEVKTTIMSTIRLDREQVEKDAAVVAQGAKVRKLENVVLYGVSYSVYCFGCEALDVRSAVLVNILKNAGVPVVPGMLPGDIRP